MCFKRTGLNRGCVLIYGGDRDVGHVESIKEVKRIYRIVIGEPGRKKTPTWET
jgi:hypothetical protein